MYFRILDYSSFKSPVPPFSRAALLAKRAQMTDGESARLQFPITLRCASLDDLF